jgi:hypothetical protein
MRSREEQHLSFTFTNNIVFFDSGTLLGSNWSNNNYRMDGNVYFDERAAANPESVKFSGATLEQWRQRGHDQNSVLADPRFVAPHKLDFRLQKQSPALKLGFKSIDLRKVGIRPKARRGME